MHRSLVALLFVAGWLHAEGPARAPLPLSAPVQDKNFFVLSLLERAHPSDAELNDLLRAKQDVLRTCADVACFTSKMRFSDDEISRAATALNRLYRSDAALREMTNGDLRRSGTYVRYQAKDGEALLDAAWRDAALGINKVIDVYGSGNAPRYAEIDSAAFDVKSKAYAQLVQPLLIDSTRRVRRRRCFFSRRSASLCTFSRSTGAMKPVATSRWRPAKMQQRCAASAQFRGATFRTR
jgi:hypothetical protein